jgi:hypothetical protein
MRRVLPQTALPQDFKLTEKTINWVNEKYPTVDVETSLERFIETAEANGWMYADWQAGFKTCVRKGVDNGWNSIVRYKQGRAQDPRWIPVLSEVEPYGFRAPYPQETPETYRGEFNSWKRKEEASKRTGVVDFSGMLRAMKK